MSNGYVHTAIIFTNKMNDLAKFYQDGFEWEPPQPTGSDHLGWKFDNLYFGLDQVDDAPTEYPGAVSLWFAVDNLQATFDKFVTLGARVKYPPTQKPWGAVLAAVFDLDGNVIGLTQHEN